MSFCGQCGTNTQKVNVYAIITCQVSKYHFGNQSNSTYMENKWMKGIPLFLSKVVDFILLKILPPANRGPLWEHSQPKGHRIWALTKIFSPFNYISMSVSHHQPALTASLRWMKGQRLGLIRQKKITSLFSAALWSLAFCLVSSFSHSLTSFLTDKV